MSKRRILDRLFQLGRPGIVAEFRPPPEQVADGLWSLERHLRMPGAAVLPSRTAIVRRGSGGLVLISPPPAHVETFAAIDGLGQVEAILAPNAFHYLYVADTVHRYPQATLYLAPGLQERVASLPPGLVLSAQAVSPELEQVILAGGRGISEVILFHRASGTLLLTDCAFNLVRFERTAERIFWRLFGVPPDFGPSRTARMMLLRSRQRAGEALRRVLDWPFERIHVAHGELVQADARARFQRAFAKYL
jgi:hypothetical protein